VDNGDRILDLAREIEERELTVRALERRLQQPGRQRKPSDPDVFLKDGEERLTKKLGTAVHIKGTPGRGTIAIRYHSKDQLIALFDALMKR